MKNLIFTLVAMALMQVTFGQEEQKRRANPEQMFGMLDQDGNGSLSFEEFSAFEPMHPRADQRQREPRDKQEVFSFIDENKNGEISKEEFLSARKRKGKHQGKMSEEEKEKRKAKMKEMKTKLKEADLNGDQKISYDEFLSIEFTNDLPMSKEELFAKLDQNNDGFIEKEEMKRKSKSKQKKKQLRRAD